MKNLYSIVLFFFTISCGYPDIDNVPDFKDAKFRDQPLATPEDRRYESGPSTPAPTAYPYERTRKRHAEKGRETNQQRG